MNNLIKFIANHPYYQNLVIQQLNNDIKTQEIYNSLCSLFLHYQMSVEHLIKSTLIKEIVVASNNTLFREYSHVLKVFDDIISMVVKQNISNDLYQSVTMDHFNDVIRKIIEQVSKISIPYEIDPKKNIKSSKIKKNQTLLLQIVDDILNQLINSTPYVIPENLCDLCINIYRIIENINCGHGCLHVTSFLFLKYICPNLVCPERIGITIEQDHVRRNLLLITKILQLIANNSIGNEQYIQFSNSFVKDKSDCLKQYINLLLLRKVKSQWTFSIPLSEEQLDKNSRCIISFFKDQRQCQPAKSLIKNAITKSAEQLPDMIETSHIPNERRLNLIRTLSTGSNLVPPNVNTFRTLLGQVQQELYSNNNQKEHLKFLYCWNHQQVINEIENQIHDHDIIEILKKYNITGSDLLLLNNKNLDLLGLKSHVIKQKLLLWIESIRSDVINTNSRLLQIYPNIREWDNKIVTLWCVLNDIEIPNQPIIGSKLISLDIDSCIQMGIFKFSSHLKILGLREQIRGNTI